MLQQKLENVFSSSPCSIVFIANMQLENEKVTWNGSSVPSLTDRLQGTQQLGDSSLLKRD